MLCYNIQETPAIIIGTASLVFNGDQHMGNVREISAEGGVEHNHAACVRQALDWAEALCARRGARLTALRRQVLEHVWSSHQAVKAYTLLDMLAPGGAKPPTVYRALQFLQEQGLVHRLESLNAYVGCPRPDHTEAGQFLICNGCGEVREMRGPAIHAALSAQAQREGFRVEQETVELRGTCERCLDGSAQ